MRIFLLSYGRSGVSGHDFRASTNKSRRFIILSRHVLFVREIFLVVAFVWLKNYLDLQCTLSILMLESSSYNLRCLLVTSVHTSCHSVSNQSGCAVAASQ